MRIELTMPTFRTEHCQLIARADRVSFLGTRGFPGHLGPTPSALRLGAPQSTGGLALAGMCYTNMYLGSEIASGLPGTSPGTLSPWVSGEGNDPLTARATGKQSFTGLLYLFN